MHSSGTSHLLAAHPQNKTFTVVLWNVFLDRVIFALIIFIEVFLPDLYYLWKKVLWVIFSDTIEVEFWYHQIFDLLVENSFENFLHTTEIANRPIVSSSFVKTGRYTSNNWILFGNNPSWDNSLLWFSVGVSRDRRCNLFSS